MLYLLILMDMFYDREAIGYAAIYDEESLTKFLKSSQIKFRQVKSIRPFELSVGMGGD